MMETTLEKPLFEFWTKKSFSKQCELSTRLILIFFSVVIHYIEEAIKDIESNSKSADESNDESILSRLVKINKKMAIVMASDMLLAGVDTTAVGATNILYCLAKNPEKQKLLREEILKVLPEKSSTLTPESMQNLPYLRAVIKETFRMRPVVGGNATRLRNKTVMCGYEVPADVYVGMPAHMEVMNPKQYPQPEKFLPERWLRDNVDPSCPHAKTANPFTFLPFGFGPRMCKFKASIKFLILIQNYSQVSENASLTLRWKF